MHLLLFILFNPNYQRRLKQNINNTSFEGIPESTNPYNVLIHRTAQLVTVLSITSPNDNYVDRLESYTLYTLLLYAHDLMINRDCLLEAIDHNSIYPKIIKNFLQHPVIANGYLYWIQYQVEENHKFLGKPKIFAKAMLTHLSLLQTILQVHHFAHPKIFNVLHALLLKAPTIETETMIDVIKHSLNLLLQLLTYGYTIPILRFIKTLVPSLDHSIIRGFLGSLGTIC